VRLRALAAAAGVVLVLAPPAAATTYSGTITFTGDDPSGATLSLHGAAATVALGPGHVSHAVVAVSRLLGSLRFAMPGRPKPLVFRLRAKGRRLVGTAQQGTAKATVSLRRGRTSADTRLGFFTGPSGPFEVMRTLREGFNERVAIDLRTGVFGAPRRGKRLPIRQEEVRFQSGKTTLAGTLTLPAGQGPFPAAVYVSGSGPTLREEAQYLGGYLVSQGVALLAYDKRGNGQSHGVYPGSLASPEAISIYADDALAAARFLAAQPDIDKTHVGLFGLSQGGWIIPLAAARATEAISWALIQGGPTVTQGESDYYGGIAGTWTGPLTEAEAQARANGPSGFDPMPSIRKLAIPMLWLYGSDDRAEPPDTSVSLLRQLLAESTRDFEIHLYSGAPHPLFSQAGFPSGMFGDVSGWLLAHRLTPGP